jgi:hypothetical protein
LYLDSRKDGLSQRWTLANNRAANAADKVQAVHKPDNADLGGNRQAPGKRAETAAPSRFAMAAPNRLNGP